MTHWLDGWAARQREWNEATRAFLDHLESCATPAATPCGCGFWRADGSPSRLPLQARWGLT